MFAAAPHLQQISRLWTTVSHIGTEGEDYPSARRLTLCNQMGVLGVIFTAGYNLLYTVYDFGLLWPVIFVNTAAMMLYASIPVCCSQGLYRQAKCLTVAMPCLQVFVVTYYLGRDCGVHLFLFDAAFLALLVSSREEKLYLAGIVLMPSALYLIAHYAFGGQPVLNVGPVLRHGLYIGTTVSAFFVNSFFFLSFYYEILKTEDLLDEQHQRSERLLLNILPEPIAERLKGEEKSIADGFTEVTVLFADIVGFTVLSSNLPPEEIVSVLNVLFSRFDAITEEHGLEKIKTIGDAYMLAGGMPIPSDDHAAAVASAALAMQSAITDFNEWSPYGAELNVRIGIHSGPVVAGVIGTTKFAYDVWGDSVNIASRMESHSVPGRIQVSERTRELLGDDFLCEPRGEIEVKGKGRMKTFYLLGQR